VHFILLCLLLACDNVENSLVIEKEIHKISSVKGALVSTKFSSLKELKKVIKIEYVSKGTSMVRLTHNADGCQVSSELSAGISELDIINARDGGLIDKAWLAFNSPYFVYNRNDLMRVYILARRRGDIFGEGDMAFYDISQKIMSNINDEDLLNMSPDDLGEKGYFNTFNHITAQSFMTSIFSEDLADFIADVHELKRLPELVTGKFTQEQIIDLNEGPVDNYVDLINNEWGQELGKVLREKHGITNQTIWTPELLANYLNDIQSYYSWVFKFSFKPFRSSDEVVVKFSRKLNSVMQELSSLI
jgi:hypothetical protein